MDPRPLIRPVLSVAALSASVFLLAACLSFSPDDWPSGRVLPPPNPPKNFCGAVGAGAAYQLHHHVGPGCYLLIGGLAAAGFVGLRRLTVTDPTLRVIGLLILAATVSTVSARFASTENALPEGPGGTVGIAVATYVLGKFGNFGAVVVILAGMSVGAALAFDDLLVRLPGAIAALANWRLHGSAGEMWAAATAWARGSRPAVAAAGATAVDDPSPNSDTESADALRPVRAPARPRALDESDSGVFDAAEAEARDGSHVDPQRRGIGFEAMAADDVAEASAGSEVRNGPAGAGEYDDFDEDWQLPPAGPVDPTTVPGDPSDPVAAATTESAPAEEPAAAEPPAESEPSAADKVLTFGSLSPVAESPKAEDPVGAAPSRRRLGLRELPRAEEPAPAAPLIAATGAAAALSTLESLEAEIARLATDPLFPSAAAAPAPKADATHLFSPSGLFDITASVEASAPAVRSQASGLFDLADLQAEAQRINSMLAETAAPADAPRAEADRGEEPTSTHEAAPSGPAAVSAPASGPAGEQLPAWATDDEWFTGRKTERSARTPAAPSAREQGGETTTHDSGLDETGPAGNPSPLFPAPEDSSRPAAAPAPTEATSVETAAAPADAGGKTTILPAMASAPVEDGYPFPPSDLLEEAATRDAAQTEASVKARAAALERALPEFGVDARVVGVDTGPVVTMFELEPAAGVKINKFTVLESDLARVLKAPSARVVAPLPDKSTVGLEVPNSEKDVVRLKELLAASSEAGAARMNIPLFLGKDASGRPLVQDLTTMPHLLIAGTTGSGKSVCINTVILSILMTRRPDDVKLILVDPKIVEMAPFKDVPHLMCPVVNDTKKAEGILEWAVNQMEERYELLAEAGVRNAAAYNRLGADEILARLRPGNDEEAARIPKKLPYIVIVIDELADLMMTSGKEVESHIARLAQKSRAVGIHLILATQRPSVDVITGLIKANMPARISFRVASRIDSRTILDQKGADLLLGQGDMLFLIPGTAKLVRAQGTYVSDEEVNRVTDFLCKRATPSFARELVQLRSSGEAEADSGRDGLFDQAVEIVLDSRRGSVSLLQRRLNIGYSRASRLIDQMAEAGIVGEYRGSAARDVIISREDWATLRGLRDRAGG
jgi:S-DNA-T family DNA segregation ATPase FtsK/SpoIIIE